MKSTDKPPDAALWCSSTVRYAPAAAPKRKSFMIVAVLALTAVPTGCAELHQHALGTRVNQFSIKGRDYVHCSILVDKAQPQMVHDALEVCRDGVNK